MNKLLGGVALLVLPLLAQAQSVPAIRGVGASFPAQVYSAWGAAYQKAKPAKLEYQAAGSGEGVRTIVAREADFGASDQPLSETDLQKNKLVQFPTVVGGLVPAYQLHGIKSGELRLTGPVLAKIFSGQIRNWNDPEIAALNRSLSLPSKPIRRIVREEASGSTRNFTAYLAMHDPAWEKRIGVGLTVQWPGSDLIAAKGTSGVADVLKGTDGGIAYLSFHEVARQGLSVAQLQNRHGSFVLPSEKSIQAAINMSEMASSGDEHASLIDLPGPDTWPLAETTYVLIPKAFKDGAQAKRVLNFFYWVFSNGDKLVAQAGFVPLPTRIQARLLTRFRDVVGPEGRPVEFLGQTPEAIWLTAASGQVGAW